MTAEVETFVALVREYQALVDGARSPHIYSLLAGSARLLPRLYAAGIDLPIVIPGDQPDDDRDDLSVPMPDLLAVLRPVDRFNDPVDPVYREDGLAVPLANDLAEIYLDLVRPLHWFEAGRQTDAVWEWRFALRGHCGDHLVAALPLIHRLAHYHVPDDRLDAARQ